MADEDSRRLTTACALESMTVQTVAGERLGRVFDLRCRRRDGEPPVVEAIVYGRLGLLERMDLRKARPTSVPWSKVRSVEGRVIVVDVAAPRRNAKR